MNTITISKKEYTKLIERQRLLELKLGALEKVIRNDDERYIRPEILKRWERISLNLDRGKGRVFTSQKAMKRWLSGF